MIDKDLKNYGLKPRNDLYDEVTTGIAWIVAMMLLIFYALGAARF